MLLEEMFDVLFLYIRLSERQSRKNLSAAVTARRTDSIPIRRHYISIGLRVGVAGAARTVAYDIAKDRGCCLVICCWGFCCQYHR